jgi:SAM-dependent methyltransferase
MRTLKLAMMLLREAVSTNDMPRRPEPTALMDHAGQVEAFHQQGHEALIPVYHFNALATSRLTPFGGTVLDLGSGSGQYLAYLAERRPDLRIIGLELAPAMVAAGRGLLEQHGLVERVELRLGDMTDFALQFGSPIATISSVFSLHHLPTRELLTACLSQIQAVRARDGCSVWIFDHARPKNASTLAQFPEIFTPSAPRAFNEDSSNSLAAAFAFEELQRALRDASLEGGEHRLSRWMQLYQFHSYVGRDDAPGVSAWKQASLSSRSLKDWKGLQFLFPTLSAEP